jgi:hypothetical protein
LALGTDASIGDGASQRSVPASLRSRISPLFFRNLLETVARSSIARLVAGFCRFAGVPHLVTVDGASSWCRSHLGRHSSPSCRVRSPRMSWLPAFAKQPLGGALPMTIGVSTQGRWMRFRVKAPTYIPSQEDPSLGQFESRDVRRRL